uniref:Uncharacterized protein n=1 Tax=Rhizophora mucronata TaxID=61149 RepID=A0A2P2N5Z9_RHIMU
MLCYMQIEREGNPFCYEDGIRKANRVTCIEICLIEGGSERRKLLIL